MSEQGREPLIRLPVDQEVYVESVYSGDTVEDATVATEVVSFDRDGDVYQLEGAIVFAGYVRRNDATEAIESFSIGTDDESENVVHIHHRMPFSLRVPVNGQQPGLVNVKSRLSGFALQASSDNWLNVRGTLEVHGLMGHEGFHFRCGAQEEGQIAPTANDVAVANPPLESVGAGDDLWRHEMDDEARQEADGNQARSAENERLEDVSEARSGHGWADEEQLPSGATDVKESMRGELANLDRFFVPPSSADSHTSEKAPARETTPIASFEFEHQIDEDVVEGKSPAISMPGSASNDYRGVDHWIPKFTIAGLVEEEEDEAPVVQDVADETMERHDLFMSPVAQSGLWSFVDFNGPEPRHTMRYVIVMEEETLEAVADRCGCLSSELQRVNPWLEGQTRTGQALYIPSGPFHIPRLPVV